MFKLLTATNPKMMKSIQYGFITAILHLAPHTLSGKNLCPNASIACSDLCLNKAGRGVFDSVQKARLNRTMIFLNNPAEFYEMLDADIEKLKRQAMKHGMQCAIRLNGTSDIPKLGLEVAEDFPEIQFYDYTKNFATLTKHLPSNYHLTFSRSETNDAECRKALALGFNVAVVFEKELPKTFFGVEVIDGDEHDLRFLDKSGVVVGLKAKGKAKKDESGFVVREKVNPYPLQISRMASVLEKILMP